MYIVQSEQAIYRHNIETRGKHFFALHVSVAKEVAGRKHSTHNFKGFPCVKGFGYLSLKPSPARERCICGNAGGQERKPHSRSPTAAASPLDKNEDPRRPEAEGPFRLAYFFSGKTQHNTEAGQSTRTHIQVPTPSYKKIAGPLKKTARKVLLPRDALSRLKNGTEPSFKQEWADRWHSARVSPSSCPSREGVLPSTRAANNPRGR